MTVTIDLKPEIEKRLAKKADEKGLPIETFIEVFIEDKLEEAENSPPEKEKSFSETATTEEWLAEFHKWLDSHKDRGKPYLSDEALRRENIYEDRF